MDIVKNRTLIYYSFFIGLGLVNGIIGPTLPFLSKNLSASIEDLSFIFIARPIGMLLASFFVGKLFDTVRGHYLLCGAAVLAGVAMLAIPQSPTYSVVIGMFFLIGFAEGVGHVGGNTLLIWNHQNKAGTRINILHSCHGLGTFLIPFALGLIIAKGIPVQVAYMTAAAFFLPFAVAFLATRSPENRMAKAAMTSGQKGLDSSITGLLMLIIFLEIGAEVGFGNWLYSYATKLELMDQSRAAYLTSAFWGSFMLGRVAGIPVLKKFGHNRTVITLLGCAILDTLLFLMLPLTSSTVWVLTIVLALSLSLLLPAVFGIAEQYMPMQGKTIGYFMVAAGIGGMVVPWVVGQTFNRLGPHVLPLFSGINLAAAMLTFLYLMRRLRHATESNGQLQVTIAG